MYLTLILEQLLNGLQYGVALFLTAAGLTLIFGIVGLINLAHGSVLMVGAFITSSIATMTGFLWIGVVAALFATLMLGLLLERFVFRRLYRRDHLDQVLATFALILFFNELMRIIFGRLPLQVEPPDFLLNPWNLFGDFYYPSYRLAIIALGILVAVGLWAITTKTKLGMLMRAGSTHREMLGALGVNVSMLFLAIFGLGSLLAGLAGAAIAPLQAVEVGMGEHVIILAFVIIVIGGIGSIRGALIASITIGIAEAVGRTIVPLLLARVFDSGAVASLSGLFTSMTAYLILAVVLLWRPQGLFNTKGL
ncbi:branched-chain amino acid ABC transporter permease [Eoetvoesiella caeni]